MTAKSRHPFEPNVVQLSIPFESMPLSETTRKKGRGNDRTADDKISKGALEPKQALQSDKIQSFEARIDIETGFISLKLN